MVQTLKETRTKYELKRTKARKEILVVGIVCRRCLMVHNHEGRYCQTCENNIMKGPY